MADPASASVTIHLKKVKKDDITREFGADAGASVWGQAYVELLKLPEFKPTLTKVLARIGRGGNLNLDVLMTADKLLDIFTTPQPVPWYFDIVGRRVLGASPDVGASILAVKACRESLWVELFAETEKPVEYQPLLAPFFHKIPTDASPESERGLADTLFFLAPRLVEIFKSPIADVERSLRRLLEWFNLTLRFKPHGDAFRVSEGKDAAVDLPLTKPGRKVVFRPKGDKPRAILVASHNIRKAIRELAQAWHNPAVRSVLVSASTGSGKEELKRLLVYALRAEERLVEFSAPQLADDSDLPATIIERLFEEDLINPKKGKIRIPGTVAFFDEIHHDDVLHVRSTLLRIVEEEKVRLKSKVYDLSGITYLFAASKPLTELRSIPPVDFWNRIEYPVEMKHPLDVELDEREEMLQDYFDVFWHKAASAERAGEDAHAKEIRDFLKRDDTVEKLAKKFGGTIRMMPLISVRSIRSIVTRLFHQAFYDVTVRKATDQQLEDKFDEWIPEFVANVPISPGAF